MIYTVIKEESINNQLMERVNFLKSYGHLTTKEEIAKTAIIQYLNKKQYTNKYASWKKKRGYKFWNENKGKCFYCNQDVPYKMCTFDHKHPLFRGGDAKDENNIAISCFWCNNDKASLTSEEYVFKQLTNASKGIYPPVPFQNHSNRT